MVSSQFRKFVSSVKEKLRKDAFPNEASVRMSIVQPVLEHLGWDTRDSSYVYPEYPLEGRKVDYGLKIVEGKEEGLRCIIEAKAVGNIIEADRQLFEYAFHAGTPLAILTDGKLWRFYLPLAAGKYNERLVRTLDFEEHSVEEVVEVLERYISFDNMRSGQAKKNAESDLYQVINRVEAKKNIPIAWGNLLDGTSDKLIDLLIEETSLISSSPERSDVEGFLKNLKSVEPELGNIPRRKPKVSNGEVHFFLLGKKYTEINAVRAYVKIIKILAARDEGFLERLVPYFLGRKNKWLSRDREDIKEPAEISAGWWLSRHLSNEDKIRRLKTACEVAGIPFGKPAGLEIMF